MQTGLSAWVLAIVTALKASGAESETLLRSIGMDPSKIGDLQHRYSQEQVTSLWIAAVEATGDENFGLKVAQHIRPSTFHVVGYAMACSGTLKRAAERFAHSARLISDSAVVDFTSVSDNYLLTVDLNTGGRQPIYQTIDTILSGFLLLCEWILSDDIRPIEVTFRHAAPGRVDDYFAIFDCPIRFGASSNSILFRAEDLERVVPAANEELAMMLDEMTSQYLALRFDNRFSRKVRDALLAQIPEGEPRKSETARLLGMTERTLLRRLRDENTTFQELLDRLREELAFTRLKNSEMTIDEIGASLGFSSSSTFSRAFTRWTGIRPSEWRDRHRQFADPAFPATALTGEG